MDSVFQADGSKHLPGDTRLRPKKIRWSMISTGTETSGSTNGAACCAKRRTCWRCCRRSLPSMLGTNFPASACAVALPAALRFDPAGGRRHVRRLSGRDQSRPQNNSRRSAPASRSRIQHRCWEGLFSLRVASDGLFYIARLQSYWCGSLG